MVCVGCEFGDPVTVAHLYILALAGRIKIQQTNRIPSSSIQSFRSAPFLLYCLLLRD
jgi:hypothetical protein